MRRLVWLMVAGLATGTMAAEETALEKAAAHILRGEADAAEPLLVEARKVAPRDPKVWTEWGYLELLRWKLSDAAGRFRKVIDDLDPKSLRARHGLARVLVRQGLFPKARAAMRDAMDLAPHDPENHWMFGNVELADIDTVGSVDRAIGHYLYASGLAPDDLRYKGWALMAHFVARRYGLAATLEATVRAQDPEDPFLLVAEGLRYELQADPAPARDRYLRATELDWYNPWAHWCLANVQLGRGNRELIEVAKLNPFFYGPVSSPGDASEHLLAVEAVAPEFPYRARLRELAEKSDAAYRAGEDPVFQEKLVKLKGYLGSIRSAPPDPSW
jgi:tetratricopeptide (TPR) repeat protein